VHHQQFDFSFAHFLLPSILQHAPSILQHAECILPFTFFGTEQQGPFILCTRAKDTLHNNLTITIHLEIAQILLPSCLLHNLLHICKRTAHFPPPVSFIVSTNKVQSCPRRETGAKQYAASELPTAHTVPSSIPPINFSSTHYPNQ